MRLPGFTQLIYRPSGWIPRRPRCCHRAHSRAGYVRIGAGENATYPRPPIRSVAQVPVPEPAQDRLPGKLFRPGPGDGGPGTGKTVTLLHRAAFLATRAAKASSADELFPTGQASTPELHAKPILLTTFNGNLTAALHAQLDLFIRDANVRRQIEVLNVDRLAYSIVRQARGNPVITDERVLRTRWAKAAAEAELSFTPAFLKNEWEQVILAQDLHTEEAYLTCPRTGRERPLSKTQRSQVWQAVHRVTARTSRDPRVHSPAASQ